MQAMTKIVYSN